MSNPTPDHILRSDIYDDVYFSVEDGLAETRHVFLDSNNLPAAWSGKQSFTICETGFGTGLNFFAVWDLFERTAAPEAALHFISFEKHPLSAAKIRGALSHWVDDFGDKIEAFLAQYPLAIPGFHRVQLSPRIMLTLIFGDVNDAMPDLSASVDCWFLDGFRPATNPDMWSEEVFANMARLSAENASYATFTAAGDVRRGLAVAGFSVEKIAGFGRKREMICGHYARGNSEGDPS